MFNVKCIVKPSILKEILPIDAMNKALIFCLSQKEVYNYNNPWIMSFNVKNLLVPTPHVKNKHINVSRYNYFLCITSLNINLCSSFHCLSKLRYLNSSIIMGYDDSVKFSFFKIWDFWFDPLLNWIINHNAQYWLCLL